jgi:hypothetical protein
LYSGAIGAALEPLPIRSSCPDDVRPLDPIRPPKIVPL